MLRLRRQIVRCLSTQRAFDWEAVAAKLTDPRASAALDSLHHLHLEIQGEAREYVQEPKPIDFDHYRKILKCKDLVDTMEENYKSIQFPTITPEDLDKITDDLPKELHVNEKKTMDDLFAQLNEKVEDSRKRIVELKELIALLEYTRTTKDTTMDEVSAMYPEVGEEIDDEIANYEWEKDTQ